MYEEYLTMDDIDEGDWYPSQAEKDFIELDDIEAIPEFEVVNLFY